jgi:hypothetical protein
MRPGARRHHDDAGGEEDRLLDVVDDEQDGLPLALPDARVTKPGPLPEGID